MATFSKKLMGKEVGDATVYAKPHTMDGKEMTIAPQSFGTNPGFPPNRSKLDTLDTSIGQFSKSAGSEPVKTAGTETRGNGCAVKGTMARGPMA